MCLKHNPNYIDKCMRPIIKTLQDSGIKTLACCCSHGKYQKTIVIRKDGENIEMLSNTVIPRKKKFYRKDKNGYYYIPELNRKQKNLKDFGWL